MFIPPTPLPGSDELARQISEEELLALITANEYPEYVTAKSELKAEGILLPLNPPTSGMFFSPLEKSAELQTLGRAEIDEFFNQL